MAAKTSTPAPDAPSEPPAIPGLAVGRIVHYVMPAESRHPGICRPAIIVGVEDAATGTVNTCVFTDGDNDGVTAAGETWWRTSVPYSPDLVAYHTWHFPEKV